MTTPVTPESRVVLDETRERFLREVVARVPVARLVELHLFPPMRQGVIETGVAVVAALPEPPRMPVPSMPLPSVADEAIAIEPLPGEPEAGEPEAGEAGAPPDHAAGAEGPSSESSPAGSPEPTPGDGRPVRHVVYTARYRLTRKGPDRGKWEAEVVAEADAPLVTVEAVVRGVRERTAEAGDPERMTGADVGAALAGADAWATTGR